MLTEDGKAMIARSVRANLKKGSGKKAEIKKKVLRHFLDYREAFGGGKATKDLVEEVERYIDKVMAT
ncbi:MAG: hypothetical protein MIO90_04865 [Methanomassiliicoccales archaeon]|nr:hypothetical protein [Methanomassiliicoccales archaeon]